MLSPLSDPWPRFDSTWSYDPLSGRYRRPNGQFMSNKAVVSLVDGRIDTLGTNLRRFTEMLVDGNITLDQWQGSVRASLKNAHIQATVLGHGGRSGMGPREYGRIGQRLRAEYTYLERFARDIVAGRVSGAMALARVQLYAESVRSSYWEGTTIRQEKQGYSMMRRVLDHKPSIVLTAFVLLPWDSGQSAACRCLLKGAPAVLIANAQLSTRGAQESTLLSKFHL